MKSKSVDKVKKTTRTLRATRKIRKYEENFDPKTFVNEAQKIYIDAHKALAEYASEISIHWHQYIMTMSFLGRRLNVYMN